METIIKNIEERLQYLWDERDIMKASLVPYDAEKEAKIDVEYQTYIDLLKDMKNDIYNLCNEINDIIRYYDVEN